MSKAEFREEVCTQFGRKVKHYRLQNGLTQMQLAKLSSLHYNYIGSVERGERNVSLENIYVLAKALNCTAKELVNFETESLPIKNGKINPMSRIDNLEMQLETLVEVIKEVKLNNDTED